MMQTYRYWPPRLAQAPAPAPSPAPSPAPAPSAPTVVAPAAVATGPWYVRMWSEPAVYGVPVVPALLVLGGLAAILAVSSGRKTTVVHR